MRKLIITVTAAALTAAAAATGVGGSEQAATARPAAHTAALAQPTGGCGGCKIG
jgi:hypothetical protein